MKPGDRVTHSEYGEGTFLKRTAAWINVDFDVGGARAFSGFCRDDVRPLNPAAGMKRLSGKTIVFTGDADPLTRADLVSQAQSLGAKVVGTVNRVTDLVVAGPGAGSKLKKAGELGIKVIDLATWARVVAGGEFECAPSPTGSGDFSIGGDLWPGLSKLIEEAGENVDLLPEMILLKALGRFKQTAGKLIGSEGSTDHWSGDLQPRMTDELGDLKAAIEFFIRKNGIDAAAVERRYQGKLFTFLAWHAEGLEKRRG